MASTSLRTAVKARLVEVFTAALPDVQVSYSWPGKNQLRECVYLGDVRGQVAQASMVGQSARKRRDDDFTVDVWVVAAKSAQTCQQAEERAEALYAELEDALADPAQAGPNLYGAGTYAAIDGLVSALISDVELLSDPSDQGWVATVRFGIDVRTRLT